MSPEPIGIGIIGTGFGALVQLPGFLSLSSARVIGIASKDGRQVAALTEKHGLPQKFSSPQELIACPDVRLVSIATPPPSHEELVLAAIAAGKDVLCEKPFTFHASQAQKMLMQARAAKIIHGVDFEFRELPAWQLMHERIASGSIGRIQSASLQWIVGTWADPKRPWAWQCDKSQGGGVLGALGVHLFDAAEWLLGPMKKVKGTLKTTVKERMDGIGKMKAVTSADHVNIEMQGQNDIAVTIALSNVEKDGAGLTMEIHGDKGILRLESLSQDYARGLRVKEGDNVLLEDNAQTQGDPRIRPFVSLAERLITAVQKRDFSFRPSFFDGLRTQMLFDAVQESDSSGGWVDIPQ